MKKILSYAVTLLLLVSILLPVGIANAADTMNARWQGIVRVTNNGTAADSVATVMSLNSTSFTSAGYADSSLSDMTIQYSGVDVPFMPGYDGDPWNIFIDSIGASTNDNYTMHSGNVTGGDINIFGSVNVTDDASLELSDNGSVSIGGAYLNQSGTIFEKEDSLLCTYDSDSENVTATMFDTAATTTTKNPNAAGTYTQLTNVGGATNWQSVSDDNDATLVRTNSTSVFTVDSYNLEASGLSTADNISHVTVTFRYSGGAASQVWATPFLILGSDNTTGTEVTDSTGNWVNVSETLARPGGGNWTVADLNALEVGIGLRGQAGVVNSQCAKIYITITYLDALGSKTVSSVSEGEHDIEVTVTNPFFRLLVDPTITPAFPDISGNISSLIFNGPLWQYENDGTTFTSVDQNAYTATVTEATWSVQGRVFDGSNDLITVNSVATGANFSNAHTVTLWVKRASDQAGADCAFGIGKTSAIFYETIQFNNATNRFSAVNSVTGSNTVNSLNTYAGDTDWHFLAIAVDSDGHINHFVIDTVDQGSSSNNVNLNGADKFYIGQLTYTAPNTNAWKGTIGEIQVFDDEMSLTEIENLRSSTVWRYSNATTENMDYVYAGSVTNNANDWTFGDEDVTPYFETAKIYKGGVLAGSWAWEYDSTLTDLSGNGNDGALTARSTSSDSDVSAELVSFSPVNESKADTFTLISSSDILSGNVSFDMFSEGTYTYVPAADAVNEFLDDTSTPRALWWYPFLILGICIIGMLAYGVTSLQSRQGVVSVESQQQGSVLAMAGVMIVFLGVVAAMGPLPPWVPILFILPCFAIIISMRHYSWG